MTSCSRRVIPGSVMIVVTYVMINAGQEELRRASCVTRMPDMSDVGEVSVLDAQRKRLLYMYVVLSRADCV